MKLAYPCEHCNEHEVYTYNMSGCYMCGAPICCHKCCLETTEQLKKEENGEEL